MLFIFDMGGVVTSTFDMRRVFEKLNVSKEVFFEICRRNDDDIWLKFETGKISAQEFWEIFNARVKFLQNHFSDEIFKIEKDAKIAREIQKIPQVDSDLFRLYFNPVLFEESARLIELLKKKHRVVCGTNTIQSHWENHLERGDYAFFDKIYASNKINCAKPDPRFFKLILEAENFPADKVFFVDDKKENCDAAKSLGINVEIMTTAKNLFEKWKKFAE